MSISKVKRNKELYEIHNQFKKHKFRGPNNRKRCICGLWQENSLRLALENGPIENIAVAYDIYNNMDICPESYRFEVFKTLNREGERIMEWFKINMHRPYSFKLLTQWMDYMVLTKREALTAYKLFKTIKVGRTLCVGHNFNSNVISVIRHYYANYEKNMVDMKRLFILSLNSEALFTQVHGLLTQEMREYLVAHVTDSVEDNIVLYLLEQTGQIKLAQHVTQTNHLNDLEVARREMLYKKYGESVRQIMSVNVRNPYRYNQRPTDKPEPARMLKEVEALINDAAIGSSYWNERYVKNALDSWIRERLKSILFKEDKTPAQMSAISARLYRLLLDYRAVVPAEVEKRRLANSNNAEGF